ncbi:hypothetical protein TNCV_792621 [Trichonephila clavipes]|nr:hypothetical protein TNCV_792621 [Trichonephila clavipes]
MLNICRGAWSIHTLDSIVLGVINLLNRKELLISEKESLPTLACGLSQNTVPQCGTRVVMFIIINLNHDQLTLTKVRKPPELAPSLLTSTTTPTGGGLSFYSSVSQTVGRAPNEHYNPTRRT